jgi:hypothetical protein
LGLLPNIRNKETKEYAIKNCLFCLNNSSSRTYEQFFMLWL